MPWSLELGLWFDVLSDVFPLPRLKVSATLFGSSGNTYAKWMTCYKFSANEFVEGCVQPLPAKQDPVFTRFCTMVGIL